MVTGQEITKITTDGAAATNIVYPNSLQIADIMNLGPAIAYVSWRKTAVVDDANCMELPSGASYEIRSGDAWNTLSVISNAATKILVVTK